MTLPTGPFQLILADPPWAFRTHSGKTRTPTAKQFNEAEDHYPTMPFAEMAELPVAQVAAKDSLLAMWIVGSHADEALALGQAWGFKYVTDLFYWAKQRLDGNQLDMFTGDILPPKISMGYHTRKQLEPCWLFKRGKGLPVRDHSQCQLILAAPREHSRKPDETFERLDALYGTNITRLEMFSRTPRAGWMAWGNEVGKFEEQAA